MPYEIQQSRWDKLLRRVSGSIGPGSRVGTSISDLFPVLDVESVPGELLLLSGTRICYGAVGVLANAGEIPEAILANPADSGLLITVTTIAVTSTTTQQIRTAIQSGVSGTLRDRQRFRDSRLVSVDSFPTGQIRSLSNPSVPAQDVEFGVIANDGVLFSDPNGLAVLAPDTEYVVAGLDLVSTIFATFWWRERAAEQSELNLP